MVLNVGPGPLERILFSCRHQVGGSQGARVMCWLRTFVTSTSGNSEMTASDEYITRVPSSFTRGSEQAPCQQGTLPLLLASAGLGVQARLSVVYDQRRKPSHGAQTSE